MTESITIRRAMLSLLLPLWSIAAAAQNIPADIQSALKTLKNHRQAFAEGVIIIEFETYSPPSIPDLRPSAVFSLCHRVNLDYESKKWSRDKAKGIEFWNRGKKAGFAVMMTAVDCQTYGALLPNPKMEYLKEKTWLCVAGNPCRARRPGEVTGMDS